MLPNAKVCLYPRDPTEAVRVLQEHGRQALILSGGTTASLSRDPNVTTMVDLTRMGLDGIEHSAEGGEARQWLLGCNVRIQALAVHEGLRGLWDGMLAEAAASVGSRPLRNAITVGGNAVAVFRWSDPPVAYLAMDASFDLTGPGGERTLTSDEFYTRHPRQLLEPGEILLRICLPEPQGAIGGAFTKFARTAFDLAVVDVAVCLKFEGSTCRDARVVVGATRTLPWRAGEAEEALVGRRVTPATVAAAARAARAATRTAGDIRTSAAYREQMVEVIVGRTIERAARLARERS